MTTKSLAISLALIVAGAAAGPAVAQSTKPARPLVTPTAAKVPSDAATRPTVAPVVPTDDVIGPEDLLQVNVW